MLQVEPVERCAGALPHDLARGLVRELAEGACVALSESVPLATLLRLLDGELANRLEHREPSLALHPLGLADEALLGQRRQPVEGVAALHRCTRSRPRRARRRRRRPRGERRARGRSPPACRGSRRSRRAGSAADRAGRGRPPAAAPAGRSSRLSIAWGVRIRIRAAASSIASGRPSRRTQISATAGAFSFVTSKSGPHRPSALDEQRDCLVLGELRQRRQVGGVRQAERRNGVLLLAGHLERASAAGQDREVRAGGEELRSPTAPAPSTCSKLSRTSSARFAPRWSMTPLDGRHAAALREVERLRDRRRDEVRVGDRRELARTRHRRGSGAIQRPATSRLSRVLPVPPGPVSVSSR